MLTGLLLEAIAFQLKCLKFSSGSYCKVMTVSLFKLVFVCRSGNPLSRLFKLWPFLMMEEVFVSSCYLVFLFSFFFSVVFFSVVFFFFLSQSVKKEWGWTTRCRLKLAWSFFHPSNCSNWRRQSLLLCAFKKNLKYYQTSTNWLWVIWGLVSVMKWK